jgi:hypothetical protein
MVLLMDADCLMSDIALMVGSVYRRTFVRLFIAWSVNRRADGGWQLVRT